MQAGAIRGLTDDGHDVTRPAEAGTRDSPSDEAVLELAADEGRILVTTDTDLLGVHERWISEGRSHSGIIVGEQDQNLKRFLRSLRHTLKRRDPEGLRNQVAWIEKAG